MKKFTFCIIYHKRKYGPYIKFINVYGRNHYNAMSQLICLLAYKYNIQASEVISID